MRPDMSKVIVERPRRGRPSKNGSAYPRGQMENRWSRDPESAPKREAYGRVYGIKQLNENFAPLVRYLRSNCGRPWNKVHSEMAARISCTSAVQKHVLDHLRDFVELDVVVVGKTPCHVGLRGYEPIDHRGRGRFYVDPRSGLLRAAPVVSRRKRNAREGT